MVVLKHNIYEQKISRINQTLTSHTRGIKNLDFMVKSICHVDEAIFREVHTKGVVDTLRAVTSSTVSQTTHVIPCNLKITKQKKCFQVRENVPRFKKKKEKRQRKQKQEKKDHTICVKYGNSIVGCISNIDRSVHRRYGDSPR